jgi:hypothetical protein
MGIKITSVVLNTGSIRLIIPLAIIKQTGGKALTFPPDV